MAEIRHLENRHNVIFSFRGWSDLDKISETGAEWHVDCGDVVEIETRCRIPIGGRFGEFNGMSSQSHLPQCRVLPHGEFSVMIPELSVTLQGAATWRIHCHDSRATCHIAGCSHLAKSMLWPCHIAGCNNSIRHIYASVVSFNIPTAQFFLLPITAASDLLVHKFYYGLVTRWWKIFEDIFIRFDATHERGRHTDRQTDGQTPAWQHRQRLCIASRGKNVQRKSCKFRFIRGFYVSISIQNILKGNL